MMSQRHLDMAHILTGLTVYESANIHVGKRAPMQQRHLDMARILIGLAECK